MPRRSELGLDAEVLHALIRSGELVEVGSDFLYPRDRLDAIIDEVRRMSDGFTVAGFRDELGITRKHAVPLLEWLDANGVTRRVGDGRVIRRPPSGERGTGGAPSP